MFSVTLTKGQLAGKGLVIGLDHAGNGCFAIRRSKVANDAILASTTVAESALKLGAGEVRETTCTFDNIPGNRRQDMRPWEPTSLYTRIPGKGKALRMARLYRSALGEVAGLDVGYLEVLGVSEGTIYGSSPAGPFQEAATLSESDWVLMPVRVEDVLPLLSDAIVGADPVKAMA